LIWRFFGRFIGPVDEPGEEEEQKLLPDLTPAAEKPEVEPEPIARPKAAE
jgi:hypothetical protein